MKTAVISDIHANLAAFEAVLTDIKMHQIAKIVCLGDIIGYGPNPEEVIQLVRQHNIQSVQGNHDFAAVNKWYIKKLNPDAQKSLLLNLEMLSEESLEFINNLKPVTLLNNARLVHGCPPDSPTSCIFLPNLYKLKQFFSSYQEQLCFFGHTHTINFFEQGLPPEQGLDVELGSYRLHPHRRYLINPGSVGQPRDSINNHAKYLIWDQEKNVVTFRSVKYDVLLTVNRLQQLKFPSYNAKRLLR